MTRRDTLILGAALLAAVVLLVVVWVTPAGANSVAPNKQSPLFQGNARISNSGETHYEPVKHKALWLCIHKQEGRWNDPNAPYYGGLQLGWWFMRTYGAWQLKHYGTADRWPPVVQLRVAERAFKREGYSLAWLRGQWPNTAPPCL